MLLVTGITGHTGRYFLHRLVESGYRGKLRCVVRESTNIDMLKSNGLDIEIVVGDLNDASFINQVMKDIKTILHIYNIHHSLAIVKAAIANNVSRAILVHTTGIYSKFKSASLEYKQIESQVIAEAENKISLTILRPSMIYGDMCDRNISKFIRMINRTMLFPLIDGGNGLIQPVNARDLGKAYYDVLINAEITANKQYDLTGDKPISIKDALILISNKLNKKIVFIPVPLTISVFFAQILKFITFGRIDIIEKVLRMGEDRAYSHEKAKSDFNYRPMTFDKGLETEVNEFKQINS